jgi:UDP-N-acetyl-D-glucosamine dehydrogenase
MTPIKDALINSLLDHSAKIGILGLGYVGLPLAAAFGEAGFQVTGIDPDPRKINCKTEENWKIICYNRFL